MIVKVYKHTVFKLKEIIIRIFLSTTLIIVNDIKDPILKSIYLIDFQKKPKSQRFPKNYYQYLNLA